MNTRNWGMRSYENVVRDGRWKTNVGTLRIGSPVKVTGGVIAQVTAESVPTQLSGCVVYEPLFFTSARPGAPEGIDTVPNGVYAQIVHGPGSKIWLKNTQAAGSVAAVAMVAGDLATLAVGDGLTPAAGGQWAKATGTPAGSTWLVVEQVWPVSGATTYGLVEARFTF